MEVKREISLPAGSWTGPVLRARVPESRTSMVSGRQEKGASGASKYRFHWPATSSQPSAVAADRKTASSERNDANASWSRSAVVFANAVSSPQPTPAAVEA